MFDEFLSWMEENKVTARPALKRVADLARTVFERDRTEAKRVLRRLSALSKAGKKATTEVQTVNKDFADRLRKQIIDKIEKPFRVAAKIALDAREPELAFDVVFHLLRFDPDNKPARDLMNHERVGGAWRRPYTVSIEKRFGLVWDREFGWILGDERARYEKGEYYLPGTKKWRPIAELNREHSDADTPWRIESEHFILYSTSELPITVEVMNRMEEFYLQRFGSTVGSSIDSGLTTGRS